MSIQYVYIFLGVNCSFSSHVKTTSYHYSSSTMFNRWNNTVNPSIFVVVCTTTIDLGDFLLKRVASSQQLDYDKQSSRYTVEFFLQIWLGNFLCRLSLWAGCSTTSFVRWPVLVSISRSLCPKNDNFTFKFS